MVDQIEASALGMLAAQIGYLREDFKLLREETAALREEIAKSNENKVSHREWSQRNEHVNNRLQGLGRELGDLRTEIRAKSAPWWSVAAVVIAGIALAWSIFQP